MFLIVKPRSQGELHKAEDLHIFVRGDPSNQGPVVSRHFLHALSPGEPPAFHHGSGRLELAAAIASRDNPLTARVIVNRVWVQLFGRGLVATPSNFGALGERPSHPELLDDLAVRFMDAGWSLKWLVREIVLSATYGQAAANGQQTADPDNRLLGRMNRRRLTVEMWRDAVLQAGGRLSSAVGGPSIDPLNTSERRRTVYSRISRLSLNPLLALFDVPDPNIHADRRVETTTPLQKLFVMNSPFMVSQADALAERLSAECGDRQWRFIERAYALLYSRLPSDAEMRLGLEFLSGGVGDPSPAQGDPRPAQGDPRRAQERRRDYAQALLAANEMLFVD